MNHILKYTDFYTTINVACSCKQYRNYKLDEVRHNWDLIQHFITGFVDFTLLRYNYLVEDLIKHANDMQLTYMGRYTCDPDIVISILRQYPNRIDELKCKFVILHLIICDDCTHVDEEIIESCRSMIGNIALKDIADNFEVSIYWSQCTKLWNECVENGYIDRDLDYSNPSWVIFMYRRYGVRDMRHALVLIRNGLNNDDILEAVTNIDVLPDQLDVISNWIRIHLTSIHVVMTWYFTGKRSFHLTHILDIYNVTSVTLLMHYYYRKDVLKKYQEYVDNIEMFRLDA